MPSPRGKFWVVLCCIPLGMSRAWPFLNSDWCHYNSRSDVYRPYIFGSLAMCMEGIKIPKKACIVYASLGFSLRWSLHTWVKNPALIHSLHSRVVTFENVTPLFFDGNRFFLWLTICWEALSASGCCVQNQSAGPAPLFRSLDPEWIGGPKNWILLWMKSIPWQRCVVKRGRDSKIISQISLLSLCTYNVLQSRQVLWNGGMNLHTSVSIQFAQSSC